MWLPRHLYNDPNLSLLADPDRLFDMPQCEIIKDQKKIRVGRVPVEFGGERRRVYLKRYNAFSWRYRLGSLFVQSGAFRSWLGAGILMNAGFHTAKPIAAVERRSWGMLTRSFYLSEEIPTARTVDDYWNQDLLPTGGVKGSRRRREFLNSLARLFRSLHETGIYHNDLKDANILFCSDKGNQDGSFYLLDLEGIGSYRNLSGRRRLKNLVQLNRTMGKYLRLSERLYLLKVYLGNAYFDRGVKRKWIQRVLRGSERGDRRSLKKR
ncbi:MAG: lipopolysaccharide kinase InaA family protein [Candidatus Binatia bacterium]